MKIPADESMAIVDSIQKSNDLLKMMAAAKLGIEEKMMKTDVIESVEGMGENIDLSV